MTKARQDDIQAKLHRMLGDNSMSSSSSSSSSSGARRVNEREPAYDVRSPITSASSSRQQSMTVEKPAQPSNMPAVASRNTESVSPSLSTNDKVNSNSGINNTVIENTNNSSSAHSAEVQWTCNTCTLINSSECDLCEACGVPRFDDLYQY